MEVRCKHEIHESMRGKPLEKWHIRIWGDLPGEVSKEGGVQKGDLIMAVFDQFGKSWNVVAVGIDGMLHRFRGIGFVDGVKSIDVEGVKVDELGRIIIES